MLPDWYFKFSNKELYVELVEILLAGGDLVGGRLVEEDVWLRLRDGRVVAQDVLEAAGTDVLQLRLGQRSWGGALLVGEEKPGGDMNGQVFLMLWFILFIAPVSLPEGLKLQSLDAGEGGSGNSSFDWSLGQPGGEQVNVVHVLVEPLEDLPVGLGDLLWSLAYVAVATHPAQLPEVIVSRQSVVPPPLDVPGHQVLSASGALLLEQVVSQLPLNRLVIFKGNETTSI